LNGNTDGTYLLVSSIKNGASAISTYSIQPNGITTNQTFVGFVVNGSGSVINTGTIFKVAFADSTAWGSGTATIHAIQSSHSVAQVRKMEMQATYSISGTLNTITGSTLWNETSTNITSLVYFCDQASGIGDGSVISLYKYAQ
jgi:hypothetical protein